MARTPKAAPLPPPVTAATPPPDAGTVRKFWDLYEGLQLAAGAYRSLELLVLAASSHDGIGRETCADLSCLMAILNGDIQRHLDGLGDRLQRHEQGRR